MIPRRMLTNEVTGSALRERVTACRKRARINRVTHRQTHSLNEASELFPEVVPTVRHCSTDVHAAPVSTVRPGRASSPEGDEREDGETVRLTEEQEVGIT